MDPDRHKERMMCFLREEISKNLDKFVGAKNTDDIRDGIKEVLTNLMTDLSDDSLEYLDFEVRDEAGQLIADPKNLFTLLLMNHVVVDPTLLKDEEEFTTDMGTFVFREGKAGFIFRKVHETSITFPDDFKIESE